MRSTRVSRIGAAALAIVAALVAAAIIMRKSPAPDVSEPSPPPSPSAPAAPPPAFAITPEITTLEGNDAFRLLVFSISLAHARLRVIDTQMTWDLATPLAASSASLLVNGGFFDKENRPEGLVISEGKRISALSDTL